jgi:hypothetical protein
MAYLLFEKYYCPGYWDYPFQTSVSVMALSLTSPPYNI